MINKIIKLLDPNLKCVDWKIKEDQFIFEVHSLNEKSTCPFCGLSSDRVHSIYQREIQDIPLQDKQVILLLNSKRMLCSNPNCTHSTFAETFEFVTPHSKKTKRLLDKILISSIKLSSVSASTLLKSEFVKTCKSSICDLIKKSTFDCR